MKSTGNILYRSLPIAVTLGLLLAFGGYMTLLVPILEGQSAAGIPKVDPLGLFKAETPGQWISLFDADSWQRDERQRNIVKADGNILVFQQYHQQDDGTLHVSRLCLLLFDKESRSPQGEMDLDGQHYPTIIEAIDGAVLTFDQSRPKAMGAYGELQQIRFLGKVQFWKEARDPKKAMFLETHKLVVTGQKAVTTEPVQFRFGDSLGRANGLELLFENPDLQQTMNPVLTRVEGISLARFGNLEHLEMQVPADKPASPDASVKPAREVTLRCQGPAEFYFDQLHANFHTFVHVHDVQSGYHLDTHLLQIQFAADETAITTDDRKSRFMPRGLTARTMVAQGDLQTGTTVVVSSPQQGTRLDAAYLTYDILARRFHADSAVPNSQHLADAPFAPWVTLVSEDLQVQVPELNLQLPEATQKNPSLGQVWATGAGKLVQQDDKNPLTVSWSKQLTLMDDPQMDDRMVASFYGDVHAMDQQDLTLDAQQLHFWLKTLQNAASGKTRYSPDLMLAQQDVRFRTTDIYGEIQEAKIYFPEDAQPLVAPRQTSVQSSDQRTGLSSIATTVGNLPAASLVRLMRPSTALPPTDAPTTPLEGARKEVDAKAKSNQGALVRGRSLTVTLTQGPAQPLDQPQAASRFSVEQSPTKSPRYLPQQIDLEGAVSITQARWDQGPLQLVEPSEYHLTGQKVHGTLKSLTAANKPLFAWTLSGPEGQPAVIQTPNLHLESEALMLDQHENRIWSSRPGSIQFPIQMQRPLLDDETADSADDESDPLSEPGLGSLTWTQQMTFDGQHLVVEGKVRCDIRQPNKKGTQHVQARADQMNLTLNQTVSFGEKRKQRPPQLQTLKLVASQPEIKPVRLYQQEYDKQQQLVAQEVVWGPSLQINRQTQTFEINGAGRLWSLRRPGTLKDSPVMLVNHQESELQYLQIQFQQSLHGDLQDGQFTFAGPVKSIHGTTSSWQVDNPLQDLTEPVELDCSQLVLNRWRVSKASDYELEMIASGSVHIVGVEYEALAERLKYNKNQDLLTIEGDIRNPAKFFQDNPLTQRRNHIFAQKIWYKPKSKWFNVEGYKEGDLTFAAQK